MKLAVSQAQGNYPVEKLTFKAVKRLLFCFWKFLLAFVFQNNTHTGYITKQNTGHDNTIQYNML